jgi:hypothetical protein
MKAYSANGSFVTNIYQQEAGDTNWNEYQVVVKTPKQTELNIRTIDTSATNLSLLDISHKLFTGNTLYATSDGANVVSGTISVTSGNIKTQNTTVSANASASSTSSPLSALSTSASANFGYQRLSHFLHPDGKTFWGVHVTNYNVIEFSLSEPGNLNTAVTTGKTYTGPNGFGQMCFSHDGRYLYGTHPTTSYTFYRYELGTPWDISTVNPNTITGKTLTTLPNTATYNGLFVSNDGTLIIIGYQGGYYAYTMSTPWDIVNITNSTVWTTTLPNSGHAVDISKDGKTICWSGYLTSTSEDVYIGTMATPFDLRTTGPAIKVTCSSATYVGNSASANHMKPMFNRNGRITLLPTIYASASGLRTYHATFDVDVLLSSNVNISTLGLSSAPIQVWTKPPAVNVHAALTSNVISCNPKELELDISMGTYTGSNATVTSATVGIDAAGVLKIGDQVSLNNTTLVTLTGVTETANGLVRQDPGSAIDYIKYNNKTFSVGLTNPRIRISGDGSRLYVAGVFSSTQWYLYQYVLTTPFDISTAVRTDPKESVLLSDTSNSVGLGGGYIFKDFDINPDGSSIFFSFVNNDVAGLSAVITYIKTYTMPQKHNIHNLVAGVTKTFTTSYATNMFQFFFKYNANGTEAAGIVYYSGSQFYMNRYVLSTPYDWSTAGSLITTTAGGSANLLYMPTTDACWSPDGLNIFHLGNSPTWPGDDAYIFTKSPSVSNSWTSVDWQGTSVSWAAAPSASLIINYPANSPISDASTYACHSMAISSDGTKLYLAKTDGTILQFNVRTKSLTKYAITYATQSGVPSSIWLPDRSTELIMTPSANANTLSLTSSLVSCNARAIQTKLTKNEINSEVSELRINLNKSQ